MEDEAYNRLILQAMLEQLGWETETAETVAGAMDKIRDGVFDAVLLDLELPDGKGLDVARFLGTRTGPHPIVVATTGHDSDEMRSQCRAAAMDGFLVKPYSLTDVSRTLEEAARHDPASWAARTPVESEGDLNLSALRMLDNSTGRTRGRTIELFAAAVEEEISLLEKAVAARDGMAAARAAHRLRALSGLVGSTALTDAAREIEARAALQPAGCVEPLRELRSLWRRVRADLDRPATGGQTPSPARNA